MPREKFEPMDNSAEMREEEMRVKKGGPFKAGIGRKIAKDMVGSSASKSGYKYDTEDIQHVSEEMIREEREHKHADDPVEEYGLGMLSDEELDPKYKVPIKEGEIVSMRSRMGDIAEDLGKGKKVNLENVGEAMEYHNLSEVARKQQDIRDERKKLREQNRGKRKSQPFSRQQEKRV